MHHAHEMKNLIYSASMTRQPDRRQGVKLTKKCVEMSIPYIYLIKSTYFVNYMSCKLGGVIYLKQL